MTKIVISFDFELGWGVLENEVWRHRQSAGVYTAMRSQIPQTLGLLKQYQLPTTWAVVSNMLVENHQDLNTRHLPRGYQQEIDYFFTHADVMTKTGIDLLEQVASMDGLCEIASHSASHIYANHPDVTTDQFVTDVLLSFQMLESFLGRPVSSLVFPRDQESYRHHLTRLKPDLNMRLNPNFDRRQGSFERTVSGMLDFVRPVKRSMTFVGSRDEIYQTGSLNFNAVGGKYKLVKKHLLKLKLKRLMKQIANGTSADLYHVWLHPFNLSESSLNYYLFKRFLAELVDLRDAGLLEVETMSSIGEMCD